jgi:ABC-2 type transport system permease protein
MNTPLNAMPQSPLDTNDAQETSPATVTATRPLYWSIRRELWENSSIYLAPLIVASVYLLGFLISAIRVPQMLTALADPVKQHDALNLPYNIAAFVLLLTAFFTGAFYCLDALYGERRDRSVLFWKSLPVSDLTTVLAKTCIPLAVLPLFAFVVILATQFVIFLLSTAFALGNGFSAVALWAQLPLFKMSLSLLCAIVASALWYAPIYGWLLLVSSFVRRGVFLSAVLPLFAIGVVERIAFNTHYFADMMTFRLTGWYSQAFAPLAPGAAPPADPLAQLTLGRFLSRPELWIGLAITVIFLALAVQLRRSREPI